MIKPTENYRRMIDILKKRIVNVINKNDKTFISHYIYKCQ